jgi:hypothetical protein
MKRFIRSRATGLYFEAGGTWTSDIGKAQDFPDICTAIHACAHYPGDCDLILQMGPEPSEQYDILLPLIPRKLEEKAKGSTPDEGRNDLNQSA